MIKTTTTLTLLGLFWALLFIPSDLLAAKKDELPIVFQDDFEKGTESWGPLGGSEWLVIVRHRCSMAFRMTGKTSYKPPKTSPGVICLLKDIEVSDFDLTVEAQSTNTKAGAHRDMCLFWGFQDPSHFYYVHLGKQRDPRSCQIFIVNGSPRTKITTEGWDGTPWDDNWHKIKVRRRIDDGTIAVYFDDMEEPVMKAQDKTFTWGRVGIGTFDDNGNWDNFVLRGVKVDKTGNR